MNIVFPRINAAAFIYFNQCWGAVPIWGSHLYISLHFLTHFVPNSDFHYSVHMQLPLAKSLILALFCCRLTMAYLSLPFLRGFKGHHAIIPRVRRRAWGRGYRCATICLHNQATPTIIISCGVYSRAGFIPLSMYLCGVYWRAAFIWRNTVCITCMCGLDRCLYSMYTFSYDVNILILWGRIISLNIHVNNLMLILGLENAIDKVDHASELSCCL